MAHGMRPPATGSGWLGFVHGSRVLAVATATDDFVQSAWAALLREDAFQAVLDLLTRHGLAATPDFALLEWQQDAASGPRLLRCVVRGAPSLDVTDATGSHTLSAAGIATWAERSLSGVTAADLTIPGVAASDAELPMESGVAHFAGLRLDFGGPLAAQAPAPAEAPAAASEVDVEATIVSHPDAPLTAVPAAEAESGVPEAESAVPEETGYDYLFGETMHRSVAEAAVQVPDAEGEAADGEAAASSDLDPLTRPAPDGIEHDGQTVLTSDVLKQRRRRKARSAEPAPKPEEAPRLVLVASPAGTREALDEPLLVGRAPSVSKVSGGALPRLLTVGNGDQDISRNHVQFTIEGGTVVVTDLHSKNGTSIVLPGKGPQTLRAGEPTAVIVGTVIDLGGGVTFTVEEER